MGPRDSRVRVSRDRDHPRGEQDRHGGPAGRLHRGGGQVCEGERVHLYRDEREDGRERRGRLHPDGPRRVREDPERDRRPPVVPRDQVQSGGDGELDLCEWERGERGGQWEGGDFVGGSRGEGRREEWRL